MEKKEKQHSQKITKLLEDIKSGNAALTSKALKALQTNGDSSIVRPLADVLLTDISADTEAEILEFIGDIKATAIADELIDIIKDENYAEQRQNLLTTIWNSTIDFSDFLAEFVEIACEGDFMEAVECLTILENLEGPFEERHILEAQLHLKDYIEDNSPKDPQKAHILSEIAILIRSFELNTDDD